MAWGQGKRAMFAKGRMKAGTMNGYEKKYEAHLKRRLEADEILWFHFEGLTLKLAPDLRLTIDFAVVAADGTLEMHDVKPKLDLIEEDAKAKLKVAAEMFPFRFFATWPTPGTAQTRWEFKEYSPKEKIEHGAECNEPEEGSEHRPTATSDVWPPRPRKDDPRKRVSRPRVSANRDGNA